MSTPRSTPQRVTPAGVAVLRSSPEIWKSMQTIHDGIQQIVQPISDFLNDPRVQAVATAIALGSQSFDDLKNKGLPADLIDSGAVAWLANHGWWVDSQFEPLFIAFLIDHLRDDLDQLDPMMEKHFESRRVAIRQRLLDEYPERADVLKESFEAHDKAYYSLSVLGFLSSADGIWRDRCRRHLFGDGGAVSAFRALEKEIGDDLLAAFLSDLIDSVPLIYNERQRSTIASFNDLNRHQVMHGESVDYGTRTNSFKAMSLLQFVEFIVPESAASATPTA